MLSQMHKIYRTFAPTYTREVFTSHSPPISQHNNIDRDFRLPTGLDATNIIQGNTATSKLPYYEVPHARLVKQKQECHK